MSTNCNAQHKQRLNNILVSRIEAYSQREEDLKSLSIDSINKSTSYKKREKLLLLVIIILGIAAFLFDRGII